MAHYFDQCRSAPESQLRKNGSAFSYDILMAATQSLSDRELKALEDDLTFHAQTGLIGIQMSRLLAQLRQDAVQEAA